MAKGWIKLHRQIMEHPFYEEERVFSRHEAWEYLLLNANHSDNKVMIDGKLITVERGSFISSIRKFQERWKWSNTKAIQFLDMLEREGMITRKSDTKKTVITIVKYDFYQGEDEEKTTPKRHSNDTETIQKHTNKNVKNVKNDNKKLYGDHVLLSDEEHSRLVEEWGAEEVQRFIDDANYYFEQKPAKKKEYTNHNLMLRRWKRMDLEKGIKRRSRPLAPVEQLLTLEQLREKEARELEESRKKRIAEGF